MSMVDITGKPESYREATAKGRIKLRAETVKRIEEGRIEKGDPVYAARIAGILAAKNTSNIIPLCHPIPITNVKVDIRISASDIVEVESTVKTKAQTGVEMEALVATAVALLTIWDMTKQYEKDSEGQYPHTLIRDIQVIRKVKE
ncbi:cyclic pyranopterin monophosphate synthase MoaC [Candidatus Bathyarchaeota archaeon]|nr:MAG: cyclic pyranopterin monophosphate synthase MoaC [Candidatus Bathyarchaeota archaeon]RLI05225.1 MAG: cyclic pyranopterin monophosphate synthase MoaC [Candidatus Bathyarchaeota archaeon]